VAEIDIRTEIEAAPAITDPVNALLVASFCVTTLLFVLTEHFGSASAALAAYTAAWHLLRRT
jgi:hypothetical protein